MRSGQIRESETEPGTPEAAFFTSSNLEPEIGSKLYTKGRTFVIAKIVYDEKLTIQKLIARCIDVGKGEGPWWRIEASCLDLRRITEH